MKQRKKVSHQVRKVAIIDTHPTVVSNIIRFACSQGWDVYLFLPPYILNNQNVMSHFSEFRILRILPIPMKESIARGLFSRIWKIVVGAFRVRFLLKKFSLDLVIIGQINPGELICSVPRKVPKIYFLHSLVDGPLQNRLGFIYGFLARIYRVCIVINSRDALSKISKAWHLSRNSKLLHVVSLASPIQPLPSRSYRRKKLLRILQVASLTEFKGVLDFVEMAKRILQEDDLRETKFLLIGAGPLQGKIMEAVQLNNLTKNFQIESNLTLDEVANRFVHADLYVQSSHVDNFPLSVLDALGFGLPCVVTDVGGMPEQVVNGETGYIVKAGHPQELAAAVAHLLRNVSLREQMSRNAQRYSELHFARSVFDRKLKELLQELNLDVF